MEAAPDSHPCMMCRVVLQARQRGEGENHTRLKRIPSDTGSPRCNCTEPSNLVKEPHGGTLSCPL